MGGAAELKVVLVLMMVVVVMIGGGGVEAQSWCVARSNVSDKALQTALDYACGAGADCAPIQSNGLCYLPNTLVSHASYAFNSFYQRKGQGSGTCDFSGTANIAISDPSYGSCVFPSSLSTAGGTTSTPTPTSTPTTGTTASTPTTSSTNTPVYSLAPGSSIPTTDTNKAALRPSITIVLPFSLLLSSFTYLFTHVVSVQR
ncbi:PLASMODESMATA CALLOSE-BINDING PROTEIN 3-like [Telopea speciosissima]|uniref:PLASMODESMATA CALLOSE-BINDING PROTEIN 3-like n=1 Tax=Telopea speciosissima TaxID=54955 RepID=UPI001CC5FBED|nr:PLASMODESMATA CALLOSE-BINDING PROTEIN 3-like [Telopea speciosissima]